MINKDVDIKKGTSFQMINFDHKLGSWRYWCKSHSSAAEQLQVPFMVTSIRVVVL